MQKRKTLEDDVDRLAERIWMRGRGKIKNKADFLATYGSYLKNTEAKDNTKLAEKVFKKLQTQHKLSSSIVTKKERAKIFMKAGVKPTPEEFDDIGKVKGRTVYVRKTFINFKGKTVQRYRDRKGRFAKVN